MAGTEYVPQFLDGGEITCTASGSITAGQLVVVTGNYAVATATAAAQSQFGVAAASAASGAKVPVYFEGVHTVGATGSIAAGVAVTAASGGTVSAATSETPAGEIVGYAFTAAANSVVDVRLSY